MVEFVAVLACTLFTGASIYISLVEHPARMACETTVAATQWAPSYKRATVMQVSLAVAAALAGFVRGWQGGDSIWLLGAVLIVAVIPFTAIFVLPTNNLLLTPGRDLGSADTRHLLENWGRLHNVRSILSLAASAIFIWSSTRS